MSRFYTPSITDEELEQGLLTGEKVWGGKPEETPGVVPLSGNAWRKEIPPGESFTNPSSIPQLATQKEGESPVIPSYSEKIFNQQQQSSNIESGGVTDFSSDFSFGIENTANNTEGGSGGGEPFVNKTLPGGQQKLDWGNIGKSWGAMDWSSRAGVVKGIATNLSTLLDILDGRDKTKIIGMGKSYSSAARGGYNPVARPWYM